MAKSNLAKILKADLPAAAELIRQKGRGRDTILAHITPREAAILKKMGGSGTINPDTNLPEFQEGLFFDPTPISEQSNYFGSFEGPAITADMFEQPMYQAPTQDYTFMSNPQAGFVQPFQAADYGIGFQPSIGSREYAIAPTNQYAQMTPQEIQRARADVFNAFRTANQPLPASVAEKAYGVRTSQQQDLLPVYTTGSPEEEALTLAQLGRGQQTTTTTAADSTEDLAKAVAAQYGVDYEGRPIIDLETASKTGILDKIQEGVTKDPLKALIAALGLGGLAYQYNQAQSQGKKVADQLRQAYGQSAAQTRELAQPYMQQGGQLLGQAVAGQLTAANQQQLEAARAQAAQQVARSGGVATAQAQRTIEEARQRLLQNQTNAAIALLGAGTPLISSAIQQQLQGTTTGIQTGLNLSQQAGQAASNLVTQLALLYGRSGR